MVCKITSAAPVKDYNTHLFILQPCQMTI